MSEVQRVKVGSFSDFVEHLKKHGDIKSLEECDLNKKEEIIMGVLENISRITSMEDEELVFVCLQEVDINFKKGHKFKVFATGVFGSNLDKLLQKGDLVAISSPTIEKNTSYWIPDDYSDKQVWVGKDLQAETKIYYAKNPNGGKLEKNFTNDNMKHKNTASRDLSPEKEIEKRTNKRKRKRIENSLESSSSSNYCVSSCENVASDLEVNCSPQLSPLHQNSNTLLSGSTSECSSSPRIVSRPHVSPVPKCSRNFTADVLQISQMPAVDQNVITSVENPLTSAADPFVPRQMAGSNENEQRMLSAQNSVLGDSQRVHDDQNQSQILQPACVPITVQNLSTSIQHLSTSSQNIFGIISGVGTSYIVQPLPATNPNFPASSVTPMVNHLSTSNQNLLGMTPIASTSNHGMPPVANTSNHGMSTVTNTSNHGMPPVANTSNHGMSTVTNTSNHGMSLVANTSNHGMSTVTNTSNHGMSLVANTSKYGIPPVANTSNHGMSLVANTSNHGIPPVANTSNHGMSLVANTSNHGIPPVANTSNHNIPSVANISYVIHQFPTVSQLLPDLSMQPGISNLTANQNNFIISSTATVPVHAPFNCSVPQMLQATCALPMVHQAQGCNVNVPGLRLSQIHRRSNHVFTKITNLMDDSTLRFNVYGLITKVTEDQSRVNRHMIIHIRDETCPSDGEFRVHVYFSGRRMKPNLEPNRIVRLMKLRVETYNNYLDGKVFSGRDITTFPELGKGTIGAECPSGKYEFCSTDLKRLKELRKWLNPPDQRSQSELSGLQSPQLFRRTYVPSANSSANVTTSPQHQDTRKAVDSSSAESSRHTAIDFEMSQENSEYFTAQSSVGPSSPVLPSTISFISDIEEEGTYILLCKVLELVHSSKNLLVVRVRDGSDCTFLLQRDIRKDIIINIAKPSASVRSIKVGDFIKIVMEVKILNNSKARVFFVCNGSDENVELIHIERRIMDNSKHTVVMSEERKQQLREEQNCGAKGVDDGKLQEEYGYVGVAVSRVNEVQGSNEEQISMISSASCCNQENNSPLPDPNSKGHDNCDETYTTEMTMKVKNVKQVDFSYFEDHSNSREKLYLIQCCLTQVEPSLTRDMIRVYCEICRNCYCWCKEEDQYCSYCLKEGRRSLLKMAFFIKLHLIDRNGKKFTVYMCNQHAEDFLDCSVRSYLRDEVKFREVNELFSKLMHQGNDKEGRRCFLKLLIQQIRMVNETIYMLVRTKLKRNSI